MPVPENSPVSENPAGKGLSGSLSERPGENSSRDSRRQVSPVIGNGQRGAGECQLPWRGQLSPQLAGHLLRDCSPPKGVVLDPFMGRGTVLVEAARLKLEAYGCEINPAAFLAGRLCELCRLSHHERHHLLEQVAGLPDMHEFKSIYASVFNGKLFSPAGSENGSEHAGNERSVNGMKTLVSEWYQRISPAGQDSGLHLLAGTLLVLMGEVAGNKRQKATRWQEIVRMIENLPLTTAPIQTFLQDARQIPLPDGSVDVVLSSPPSVNEGESRQGVNQIVKRMGWNLRAAARSEIGSGRRFRQNPFLGVLQYCMDMALVLNELRRVCHGRSQIVLVVRHQSIIRQVPFFNATIVGRIATGITGMTVQRTQKQVAGTRSGRNERQDLLHLLPGENHRSDITSIMERARAVGQDILVRTVQYGTLSTRMLLEQAIIQAGNVRPSPWLVPEHLRGNQGLKTIDKVMNRHDCQ